MNILALLCALVPALVAPLTPRFSIAPALAANMQVDAASDSTCADLGQQWERPEIQQAHAQFGTGLSLDAFHVYTGCWQDANGAWFYPVSPDDPRLPGGPILSAQESQAVSALQAKIAAQAAVMDSELPDWIAQFVGQLKPQAVTAYGRPKPGFGPEYSGNTATMMQYYIPAAAQVVQRPDNYELGTLAAWWYQRRQAGVPMTNTGNPFYGPAINNVLQDFRAPWSWELADPVLQAEYFRFALDHGLITFGPAAGAPTAPTTTATASDCGPFALWLGATVERINAVLALRPANLSTTPAATLSANQVQVQAIAARQRESSPPTALVEESVQIAADLTALADAYGALATTASGTTARSALDRAEQQLRGDAGMFGRKMTLCGLL